MKKILDIYVVFFLLILSISDAAADEEKNTIRVWTGVDVITNEYDIVEQVKKLTGIKPGDIIPLDDARLPAACNSIRAEYKQWTVVCTAVEMKESTALYVVQISKNIAVEEKFTACSHQKIPMELSELMRIFNEGSEIESKKIDTFSGSEFINNDEVLDSTDSEKHRRSKKYFINVAPMMTKIESMFESCNPVERKNSITMMNYAGNSKRAILLAMRGIHDSDMTVRNVSLRLIASFGNFTLDSQNEEILSIACKSIERENFFDRNKGLMVLLSVLRQKDWLVSSISPQCVSAISKISAFSESDQIGNPAKIILKLFH